MGNLFYEQLQKESDGTIQKMEWISVKDRMPKPPEKIYAPPYWGRTVIVCTKRGTVKVLEYVQTVVRKKVVQRFEYMWDRIYDGDEITHWMPLPEPPKEV